MDRFADASTWLSNNTGDLVGISLSLGGTSFDNSIELKRYLGVPMHNMADVSLGQFVSMNSADRSTLIHGIDALKIKSLPEIKYLEYTKQNKKTKKNVDAAYLIISANPYIQNQTLPIKNEAEFYLDVTDPKYTDVTMVASGDNEGFMIHVIGDSNILNLQNLYKHFISTDIVFSRELENWNTSMSHTYGFGYASKLDDAIISTLEAKHQYKYDFYSMISNTNIIQELQQSNKKWHALSPSLHDGELKFFLNPANQSEYEHGWFTVSELRDWINDKGPVLKSFNRDHTSSMEL